ncbi:MAG: membrane-bound lytic murein transglycosylase MltF [Gammaproteobacteria bacterium]|nr:membrane-bound lytic murein transglycosylase MltF [Gammaproteobacteria bacterium]
MEQVLRILLVILFIGLLGSCNNKPTTMLERVKKQGELVVITRNSPTTYYLGPEGYTGLEYDLISRFANELDVKLKIIIPESFNQIIPMIVNGDAHLAAAGLTITDLRKQAVKFAPPYQEITQKLVYRMGINERPRSIEDIGDRQLEVIAGSSHVERLKELKEDFSELSWIENEELESEQLLSLVSEQVIDFTIADSSELSLNQRFHKDLRVAFDISEPESLAWAFPISTDQSLYNMAVEFFNKLKENGELDQLIEKYYSHIDALNFVGTQLFLRHVKTRLPTYQKVFRRAGKESDLDWRLLAAIGYQESHWKPRAKSPTGVRGIMMLTLNTARQLKIKNRLDPVQSILGGARYIKSMVNRIPRRIQMPDRLWMALAAYNVGYGHVEDARKITQKRKGDPDKWVDVKKSLPLLSRKKWYKKTKHGYARGREPVKYVENIRGYYDLLVWHDNQEQKDISSPKEIKTPAIDSPVL